MTAGLLLALLCLPQEGPLPTAAEARAGLERALSWLVRNQEPDGAWGHWRHPESEDWSNPETQRSWQVATTGLACLALMAAGHEEVHAKALEHGVDSLLRQGVVRRPSGWDTDNVWAHLYQFAALVRAWHDPHFQGAEQAPRRQAIRALGEQVLDKLWLYQAPIGGWAYYDDETQAYRPSWATSFATAVGVLALLEAREQGWEVEPSRLERAVAAIERCRLPNGAYTYTVEVVPAPDGAAGINQVKGSLSRIQVCNLALWRAREAGIGKGLVGVGEMRSGIEAFSRDHRFLDIARMRPIPHEAWYYNSGYFYLFGHAYAGEVLRLLDEETRRRQAPRLWREILKTQAADGSMMDFYMNDYGRPYGTAFGILGLAASLPDGA